MDNKMSIFEEFGAFKAQRPIKGTVANSVDPDQTLQNLASDRGLHSLHQVLNSTFYKNIVIIKTNEHP